MNMRKHLSHARGELTWRLRNLSGKNNKIWVIVYHGVEENIVDPELNCLHLSADQFKRQLKFLRTHFNILSTDELEGYITGEKKPASPNCVLTFDDGYKNNLYVVAPFLKKYSIPFTVFISTIYPENGGLMPTSLLRLAILKTDKPVFGLDTLSLALRTDTREERMSAYKIVKSIVRTSPQSLVRRIIGEVENQVPSHQWERHKSAMRSDLLMDWREINEIQKLGATIGAHCHEHTILHEGQSRQEIDHQLHRCTQLLKKNIGDVRYFAFPNGDIKDTSRHALRTLRSLDYRLAFTTMRGEVNESTNRFLIPRILFKNIKSAIPSHV